MNGIISSHIRNMRNDMAMMYLNEKIRTHPITNMLNIKAAS